MLHVWLYLACVKHQAIFWDDVLPYISIATVAVKAALGIEVSLRSGARSDAHAGIGGGDAACPLGYDEPERCDVAQELCCGSLYDSSTCCCALLFAAIAMVKLHAKRSWPTRTLNRR